MSIWCSWSHIGTDMTDWYEVTEGLAEMDLGDGERPKGRLVPKVAERGNVVSYAEGFSNHYPNLDGTHERPAAVAVAHIPSWCVPGYRDHEVFDEVGPWLRLEVAATQTLNFWEKDEDGNPKVEDNGATVCLDVEAVTALRDDLNKWLEMEHLTPR